MRRKIVIISILTLLAAIANVFISIAVLSLKTYGIAGFTYDIAMIEHNNFFQTFGVLFGIEIVIVVFKSLFAWTNSSKTTLAKDKDKLENAMFLSPKETRRVFSRDEFNRYHGQSQILIGLSHDVAVGYKLQHTLVLGSQGTGKTVTFVQPQIEFLLKCKNKPSIIVTDIKGELLKQHYQSAIQNGYDVKILNLKEPLKSLKWNPLSDILKLKIEEMQTSRKAEKTVKIAEEINEVIEGLFPVKNIEQSVWEESARDIIKAIIYAMLEDYEVKKLNSTQFNFITVADIVSQKGIDCENLRKYFEFREMRSEARRLAMKSLDAVVETRSGFINALENYLAPFADKAVATLLSETEIDINSVSIGRTIIFIEMSEIATTRHFIATAFLSKLYKELLNIADYNSNCGIENNEIFYMLEEVGNLPAIPKLDKMLSAGRGRKIFVGIVIQSYTQLNKIYGDNVARTIRDNIDVEIFIGSNDLATAEEFSRKCGNMVITARSESRNNEKLSESNSLRERPLIYPAELMSLNNPPEIMGNAIVKIRGERKPLKAKYTPYFKLRKTAESIPPTISSCEIANTEFYNIAKIFEMSDEKISTISEIVTDKTTEKHKEGDNPNAESEKQKLPIKLSQKAIQLIVEHCQVAEVEIEELLGKREVKSIVTLIDKALLVVQKSDKIVLTSAKTILGRVDA